MKKLILFLSFIISFSSYAQAEFEGVKITENTTSPAAPFVNVQETDGVINKINKGDLIDVVIVNTTAELTAGIGNVNKLYATRDNTIIYRFNGTIYVPLGNDLSNYVTLNTDQTIQANKTLNGVLTIGAVGTNNSRLAFGGNSTLTDGIGNVMLASKNNGLALWARYTGATNTYAAIFSTSRILGSEKVFGFPNQNGVFALTEEPSSITSGYLPFFNASKNLANSGLFQDANGNVGLGTAAPFSGTNARYFTAEAGTASGYSNSVNGTASGLFASNGSFSFINERRNLPMLFFTNNTERGRFTEGGLLRLANLTGGTGNRIVTSSTSGDLSNTSPDFLIAMSSTSDAATAGARQSVINTAANQAFINKLNASGQIDNWIMDASLNFLKYQNVTRTGTVNFIFQPTAPNPTAPAHLATKAYVDAAVASGGGGGGGSSFLPYQRIVRFEVPLNTVNPLIQTGTTVNEITHPQLIENDWGVLMLPTTYSPTGAPTRLIIGCHGGGGTVTATGSQTETYDLYKYLVSQGYAVMDMAGMPASMATRLEVDQFRVMGNPVAVTAYQKGYEWVIRNYNINREGVFINGGSNGGLTGLNIVENSNIPVIAMSGMSPLVDVENNAWNLTTPSISGGWATSFGNRLNLIKLYGMADPTVFEPDGVTVNVSASQTNLNSSTFEADKMIGFAPMLTNVWDDAGVKKKKLKVPYKIWQPLDDPAVLHSSAVTFTNMLKAGGSYAILRTMDSGGHAPETAGTPIGTFVYDGATLNLHASVAELLQWYNRFN